MDKSRGLYRCLFGAAALLAMIITMSGCTRAFYRKSADKEVNDVLAEKDTNPQWKIEQWHVEPDPRARFADTSNPDRPPMPPDDPEAWKNSPHPQKPGHHAGVGDIWGTGYLEMIKAWDGENREKRQADDAREKEAAGQAVAPKHPIKDYLNEISADPNKGFVLRLDQAIELGVVNSPQYQTFREDLYRAALPVTLKRYGFAYQWAATADWIREWAGPNAQGGAQNNWTGSSTIGFNKLFATGALLSADFTNTTVFNFVGNGFTSGSNVNLNLAQPFLQRGGKAVTLEPLTQAERNLFYSIRAYARFREQFNVAISLGSNLPSSLISAAGTSNTASPISVLAALGIASTDVSGGSVGYLPVLYRQCDMALDKKYAHDLQEALKIIEAYQEGGFYSPLQVDTIRSTLLQAKNTVLLDRQFVANGLDQFKLLLGLPANLPLILDDTPARPVTLQFDRYYEVIDDSTTASKRLEKVEKQELLSAKELRAYLLETFTNETKSPMIRGTKFQKKLPDSWDKWRAAKGKDFQDRMEKFSKERRDLFDLKTDLELKGQPFSEENAAKLREVTLQYDLGSLERELRVYDTEPWTKLPKNQARDKQIGLARQATQKAKDVMVHARNERFEGVSTFWPAVPTAMLEELDLVTADVEQAQEVAVKAALQNRLDLMNARAQVVDSWRQLKVTANALMGVATVQYTLQAQTPPDGVRPLVFSGAATNQQMSLNFQLPLNRLAERNAYRTALINYQVARRSLMSLEDNVAAQVRFDVRQLQLFVANYQIQKQSIHSLYKQVDSALEVIVAPTDPDQLKGSSTAGQANAATLTNQYLGALNSLNNAQVKMYGIWLSIYATRMQLYLDLDRLPLDLRGVWVDEMSYVPVPASEEARRPSNRDVIRGVSEQHDAPIRTGINRPVFLAPRGLERQGDKVTR